MDQKGDIEEARPMWAVEEELGTIAKDISDRWQNDQRYLNDDPATMTQVKNEFRDEVNRQYEGLNFNKNIFENAVKDVEDAL